MWKVEAKHSTESNVRPLTVKFLLSHLVWSSGGPKFWGVCVWIFLSSRFRLAFLVACVCSGLHVTWDASCCQVEGQYWGVGELPSTSQFQVRDTSVHFLAPAFPPDPQATHFSQRVRLHLPLRWGPARGRKHSGGVGVTIGFSVLCFTTQHLVRLE